MDAVLTATNWHDDMRAVGVHGMAIEPLHTGCQHGNKNGCMARLI
jgi:hypothetical protein